MNGEALSTSNGSSITATQPQIADQDLEQLLKALEAIYNPRSSNHLRKDATLFLDRIKTEPSAPASGFALASDRDRPAVVRHYGLSLLEFAIKYRWVELDPAQHQALRGWVVQLASAAADQDPSFIRNKIAQIWAEVAKRGWTPEWMNMDELLQGLFDRSFAHQEIVLHVLETLSEESFSRDTFNDIVKTTEPGTSRQVDLGRACVEIFTPVSLWSEAHGKTMLGVRYGDDGWLKRLTSALEWCLGQDLDKNEQVKSSAVKMLNVLRSALSWIQPKAITDARTIEFCAQYLLNDDVGLRMAATEVFHALYHRVPSTFEDDDVSSLVSPLLRTQGVGLLQNIYQKSCSSLDDLDEQQYAMLKKFTEFICALCSYIEQRPKIVLEDADLDSTLRFLALILQNTSLVVSIPVLYIWTKLLLCREVMDHSTTTQLVPGLLEICSMRLIRYESFPRDAQDESFLFLQEDFDTTPERHAFVGNYRRFCTDLIERVVSMSPMAAVQHIITQANNLLHNLYDSGPAFQPDEFSNSSMTLLKTDAQISVVLTALKGYMRWYTSRPADAPSARSEHTGLQKNLEEWCKQLLQTEFQDPVIEKRVFQMVVEIIQICLSKESRVVLDVFKHVISSEPRQKSNSMSLYDDAVRDLDATKPRELHKLAFRSSNVFVQVFEDLQQSISHYTSTYSLEARVKLDYQAFLFIVIQRTSAIDSSDKTNRISTMLQGIIDAWKDPQITQSLETFDGFCSLLNLDQYPTYFLNAKAQAIVDWSTVQIDDAGRQAKERISARTDELPLLSTRTFLSASTEKIKVGSNEYEIAKAQWSKAVPVILPSVLKIVGYSHGFASAENWSNFPTEMQEIVNRTLVDRVWQSGISNETKDDFYARVRNSKYTLEGFASAVRAAVRNVRELSYWVLHCMSQFGDAFYSHQELPEAVATALYANAHTLSPHQLSTLLKLSSALINGCPPEHRSNFLPPLLTSLFRQMDAKIMTDYAAMEQRKAQNTSEDALDAEMKAESVLRQLTYAAASLVAGLMVPYVNPSTGKQLDDNARTMTIRALVLKSPDIMEPLFVFCTHLLRIQDHRCCLAVIRTLRELIPDFADTRPACAGSSTVKPGSVEPQVAAQAREYICSDVLQAAITSIHEPYFTDLTRDLGYLVAKILAYYSTSTPTARNVLLSLPGMTEERVDQALDEIMPATNERHQRNSVLELLEGVRGRTIWEEGRISLGVEPPKKKRESNRWTAPQPDANGDMDTDEAIRIQRGGSPEPGAMNELFG